MVACRKNTGGESARTDSSTACKEAHCERVSSFESTVVRVRRDPEGAGGPARAQSAPAADEGRAPGESGRPASTPLPLRQPGVHAERPQRTVLLAGPLAPVLPGAAAGGPAPALGPRRQLGPHPLARPALCHRSRTGGPVLLRHHAGGEGPGHRHVPRRGGRQHGGRFPRPAAVELAQGSRAAGHPLRGAGRATAAVRGLRPLHLGRRRRVLCPLAGDRPVPPRGPPLRHQLPVPLGGPGALGVPAPLRGGRPVHAAGRRRCLPLLLAHRQCRRWLAPAHPGVLQSRERWPVPHRRLRHRARQVRRRRARPAHLRTGVSRRRTCAHRLPRWRGWRHRHAQHESRQAHPADGQLPRRILRRPRGAGTSKETARSSPATGTRF